MSTLQDLAERLRAGVRRLPIDIVVVAADQLVVATELLGWVRRTSQQPMGVPQLAAAVEHLEHAVRAMRAAQDQVEEYLAAIGLSTVPVSDATGRIIRRAQLPEDEAPPPQAERQVVPLQRWWVARVDEITSDDGERPAGSAAGASTDGTANGGGPGKGSAGDTDPVGLLRRVAELVRSDDRSTLRDDLRRAHPPVGLGLAAVAPAALRRLATDLLGRAPRPDDVRHLTELTESRTRQLLPGLPAAVGQTLIARVCRVPPEQRERERAERERALAEARQEREKAQRERGQDGRPTTQPLPEVDHPADAAVAGAVIVGILAQRLGRDPQTLDKELTEPEPPHG